MNDQPLPTNVAGSGEAPASGRSDELRPVSSEVPAVPEFAPTPGMSPTPPAGGQPPAQPQSKLSAADVAAAIAAVPGGPPQVSAGGVVPVPTVADDVDVIEPEWVNKAEEQVRLHAGDPYGEEEAIEDLQEDYLQKRYGINVDDPNQDRGDSAAGKSGAA
jgi:hypothetical protein